MGIMADVKALVAKMTLEEKAAMCSGADFWHTESVERLGIPASMVSDGPHGLRKQDLAADHLGVNESIKAVCFPAGCGTAASFNRELITRMGEALGEECQAEGVSVILGPAVNIKRSPLCGRNFEYYSEDPFVAGEIAAAHITGVQSRKVGTSIKHFLANNQETRRMSATSEAEERTLREIYMPAFEIAVKKAKPWTVMCSYNKINGVYAAENHKYLTDVLRGEWGFDGYVMSDWGAVNDRVADLKAGLDLEMPSSGGAYDARIIEAVKNGSLEEAVLDQAVERILNIVYRFEENRDTEAVFDRDLHDALAREVAEETIVLLKNEGVLPLKEEQKAVFIGKYAKEPRYQGGGSSHINSSRITSALSMAAGNPNVVYAQGFEDDKDVINDTLIQEAVQAAKEADVAVIFAGLPDAFESEGFDRTHMRMPECQNVLIHEVAKVQPNTVVVLHNGSPVEMPWEQEVKGIVEAYLGGQAVGAAEYDILYGKVNPSAKLAETFPMRLEDNPSYLDFAGDEDRVVYREGVFVGYRYYDKKQMEVLFPFGHGLSYTEFAYSNLRLNAHSMRETDTLEVLVDVTNTGKLAGKEVVQLYVEDKESTMPRPVKELKGFDKVFLEPGETRTVSFALDQRAFAYYNEEVQDWCVESGEFGILIGASSRDIRLQDTVMVEAERPKKKYTLDSTFGDVKADPKAYACAREIMDAYEKKCLGDNEGDAGAEAISREMQEAMTRYMPLRGVLSFSEITTIDELERIVDEMNR